MIYDEDLVSEFFARQVTLEPTEAFILVAGARKKYDPELSRSHEVIFRELIRSNVNTRFIRKVKRLTASMLDVVEFETDIKIDSLKAGTMYMKPNPSDLVKGYIGFKNKIDKYLIEAITNNEALKHMTKIDTHLFSEIHKTKGRRLVGLIDVDTKHPIVLAFLLDSLDHKGIEYITETHGGYHIIYRLNVLGRAVHDRLWRTMLEEVMTTAKIEGEVEFKKVHNFMTPVWGVLQGGFKVKEYKF